MDTPQSLLEATRKFSTPLAAHDYLTNLRWPDGVVPCPHCGGTAHYWLARQLRWKCKTCKKQFSVKVGTIFEDSPLGLDKWLIAVWLITNCKNGISSCELARDLKVTQKTAWFMNHRIRLAMRNGSFEMLGGRNGTPVEVDETFIGANARNMHRDVREAKGITGGTKGHRAIVMGMLERGGKVVTFHVEDTKARTLLPRLRRHVKEDSYLYTDTLPSYVMAGDHFRHSMVDHAVEYVNGIVHTNNMENYLSLLKRTIKGTYVSVEPFHLHVYLDEQAFRYNERKGTDATRFNLVTSQVAGKRLTYKRLIGKESAAGSWI